MTKSKIEFLAAVWGLSVRAAGRWLEYDPPAPLDAWILMPGWFGGLSAKTTCKITPAFLANINAAHQMAYSPRPGTAQAGIWMLANDAAQQRGVFIPLPKALADWAEGKAQAPQLDPQKGQSAAACVTIRQWVEFLANRPFIEAEFEDAPPSDGGQT